MKGQLESIVEHMYRAGIQYDDALREFQKTFMLIALRQEKGNQCKAAVKLGMHRNTLHTTISGFEIDVNAIRQAQRRLPPRGVKSSSSEEQSNSYKLRPDL
jgi:DNA-binding NtrC family response regulator